MGSQESLTKTLDECAVQAVSLLHFITGNAPNSKIEDSYKQLKASKQSVYRNSLFRNLGTLTNELEDETISEENKAELRKLLDKIDLATFAYNILQDEEYQTCVNSFFQRAVSSFNEYTKNEIQLFLCLRLYLLRQEMNLHLDADRKELVNKHFPKEPKAYHFGDNTSEKEAGRRQIMMAVNIVSQFLCSKASDLDRTVRFGAVVMVKKFLHDFIQYKLDADFDYEADREMEESFPETEDEIKALVDEIFKEDFINKVMDEVLASESNENVYKVEQDSEEDNDQNSDSSESNSDDDMSMDDDDEVGGSNSISRASTSRPRITDEQPGARAVTAEEADFSGTGSSSHSSYASTTNDFTTSSQYQRSSDSNTRNLRKRRAHRNPEAMTVNGDEEIDEREEEEEGETQPSHVVYVGRDGIIRAVPKVPKTRKRAQRWTDDEVQALEEGLNIFKRRAWAQILEMYSDKLSLHTSPQLKDKAVNEVKRRRNEGLPLGGFKYHVNPQ